MFDPATSTLVPGDSITKTCTFDVTAVGDHLRATLAATGGAESAPAAGGDLGLDVDTTAGSPWTACHGHLDHRGQQR